MRSNIIGMAIIYSLLGGIGHAGEAQSQLFPPQNVDGAEPAECPVGEERFMSWQRGAASTFCRTPQGVLHLAIPRCAESEVVTYEEGNFVCRPPQGGAPGIMPPFPDAIVCSTTRYSHFKVVFTLDVIGHPWVRDSDGDMLVSYASNGTPECMLYFDEHGNNAGGGVCRVADNPEQFNFCRGKSIEELKKEGRTFNAYTPVR